MNKIQNFIIIITTLIIASLIRLKKYLYIYIYNKKLYLFLNNIRLQSQISLKK